MAEGRGDAAAKSAPRGQVFVENVAWARTAYDALRAIDAVKKHRPAFSWSGEQ